VCLSCWVSRLTPTTGIVAGVALLAAAAVVAAVVLPGSDSSSRAAAPRASAPAQAPPLSLPPGLSTPAPVAPASTAIAVPTIPVVPVAPLKTVEEPDAFVTLPRTATAAQLAAAAAIPFVTALTVADTGAVHLGALAAAIPASAAATGVAPAAAVSAPAAPSVTDPVVHVLGVDPSNFRAFTPSITASSDPLWSSVARGELTVDYGLGLPQPELGTSTVVRNGSHGLPLRLGAFAATGLPHAGALVTDAVARLLGFQLSDAVVLSAPQADPTVLTARLQAVFGPKAQVELLGRFAVDTSLTSSGGSGTGKPRTYRELYQAAATTCPGLSWTVLAAIGQIESDHGKNIGPSSAGALGPMQFLPSTWAKWGRDADGDGKADILDPFDAVYSAAAYLCAYDPGAGLTNLRAAVFAYNHADWYVDEVLALAVRYR
jgi:hypothetical protein